MGPGIISFLVALGASAWLYAKLQRSSGNNTQQSVTASTIAGVLIFLIAFFLLRSIL